MLKKANINCQLDCETTGKNGAEWDNPFRQCHAARAGLG